MGSRMLVAMILPLLLSLGGVLPISASSGRSYLVATEATIYYPLDYDGDGIVDAYYTVSYKVDRYRRGVIRIPTETVTVVFRGVSNRKIVGKEVYKVYAGSWWVKVYDTYPYWDYYTYKPVGVSK